jgi:hypothetical protein
VNRRWVDTAGLADVIKSRYLLPWFVRIGLDLVTDEDDLNRALEPPGIWPHMRAVGRVFAAEDRWFGELSQFDPKCPYEEYGRPAQVSTSVVGDSDLPMPFAACARGFCTSKARSALR